MSQDPSLLNLELKIAKLLRYGVLVAGAFMLAGWCTMLDFSRNTLLVFHDYRSLPFTDSLEAAWANKEWGLLTSYLGLVILISLPLLRVLMTGILFIKQKEKIMATLALVVFFALVISFTQGIEL